MKKKFLSVATASVLAVSMLAGCGGDNGNNASSSAPADSSSAAAASSSAAAPADSSSAAPADDNNGLLPALSEAE